jgi:hypothetical protein
MSQIPQLFFAAGAAVVLAGAFMIILRYGKSLREDLGLPTNTFKGTGARRPSAPAGLTRDTYAMGRKLKAQGIPGAASLATMSPAEREFFLSAVSARVGDGSAPRLVKPAPEPTTGPRAEPRTGPKPQPRAPSATPVPEAALVTGPIHCPVCRTPIGRRTDAISMTKCPGCTRRVGARVEGDRLIVTVNYTLRS